VFQVKIYITLKEGVADPQGVTIKHALDSLGYEEVKEVRTGKFFQLKIASKNKDEVKEKVRSMCEKILVNPVIENYEYRIEEII